MSRSNPTETSPNPCKRWFEWDGTNGCLVWYDKEKKQQFEHPPKLTFIPLDRLAKIHGFHQRSQSSIYSNEVRDTRQEAMVVKSFKGGPIADGFYSDIKDKVNVAGGKFTISLYAAFRPDTKKGAPLVLCNFLMAGTARNAWMDFEKEHGAQIFTKAVSFDGYKDGSKGNIAWRSPVFKMQEVSEATDAEAKELDKTILQPFLTSYFKRNTVARATPHDAEPLDERTAKEADEAAAQQTGDDSDMPF